MSTSLSKYRVSLCTIAVKWREEYPEWDVKGIGFATPCCISKHLVPASKEIFTSFVHHFDAVVRLSMGSIQDLHNGMRLFSKRVGNRAHSAVALYHALTRLILNTENENVLAIASEISEIINQNLHNEWQTTDSVSHLYPAGEIYQFWREPRGKDLMSYRIHHGDTQHYGRLEFSPTMLSDHGTAGYTEAFENLLVLSVVETKIFIFRFKKSFKIFSFCSFSTPLCSKATFPGYFLFMDWNLFLTEA